MEQQKLAKRYKLIERLGEGGMGCVWLAYDERLRREVAIKEVIVPPGLPHEKVQDFYNRATREARNATKLNDNPAIVTIYDIFIEEETFRPWIIMELVRHPTLAQYIEDHGPLAPAEALPLAKQLLEVIAEVHSKGVLHRDIKPSNIMLRKNGQPMLIDFGIARHFQDTAITQAGAFMGTPAYMAPECVNQVLSCAASDLWGIGAVLQFLLSGVSPFERPTLYSTLNAVNNEAPAPLEIEGPLPLVIQGLLHKDHEQRLTAAGALEYLAAAVEAKTETATPPTSVEREVEKPPTTKHQQVRWFRRPMLAASAVLIAGSVAAYSISHGSDDKSPSHAKASNSTAVVSPSGDATKIIAPSETTASPSSSMPSPSYNYDIDGGYYKDGNFSFPIIGGWKVSAANEVKVVFWGGGEKYFTVEPLKTKDLEQAVAQERKLDGSAANTSLPDAVMDADQAAWWAYTTNLYVCPSHKGSAVSGFPCGRNDCWARVQRGADNRLFRFTLTRVSQGKSIVYASDELNDLVEKVTTY